MPSFSCLKCGKDLTSVHQSLDGGSLHCPQCGLVDRAISTSTELGIGISEHVLALKRSESKAVGFYESPREGCASSADLTPDSTLSYSISGRPPQGEDESNIRNHWPICKPPAERCPALKEEWKLPRLPWKPICPAVYLASPWWGYRKLPCVKLATGSSRRFRTAG